MLPCCFSDHLAYANGLGDYEISPIPGWFTNLSFRCFLVF